jgi:hypothetical protein
MSDDAGPLELPAWWFYRAGYDIGHDRVERERHGHFTSGTRPMEALDAYARRMGWDRDPGAMALMREGLDDALAGRRPAY